MDDLIERSAPPGGVPYLLKAPVNPDPLVLLLLHGFTGDERVMWVLNPIFPSNAIIASLRGIRPAALGGYEWASSPSGIDADMLDFRDAAHALQAVYGDIIRTLTPSSPHRLLLIGFSQGAALSFAAAALGSLQPHGIASLAGFLPYGDLSALAGQAVFWGHGTSDELIPIGRARADLLRLEAHEVPVQFCEAEVGHKLGVECTKGLKKWLQHRSS
jgi:phospholipase/carboxylesterase